MTINEKIIKFINEMNYLNNPHVIGILFYGSFLTGFNTENSDIDLHIIFDNDSPNHLIRGNKVIDNTTIEYFEKPLQDIYLTIDEAYHNQDNAPLSIFGKSQIIYDKNNQMKTLQNYVTEKFSKPLPTLNEDEAQEQVAIINNRMEKLYQYAFNNDPYFTHLYHLTIEKIRRFYHNLMGFPRIETTKGFRLYQDSEYQKSLYINDIPDPKFINLYFKALLAPQTPPLAKYQLISNLYNYTKRNIIFNSEEHRIPIKSKNDGFNPPIVKPTNILEINQLPIPKVILKKVLLFIKEMNYLNNKHCLGITISGSSLTGFNTKDSDIDLQVIFDNHEPNRLIRGVKTIDGTKIEYFEKPLNDHYLTIENEYQNQNNASYSIIGRGSVVFDKTGEINKLKQYAINRFTPPMPPLNEDEIREQISIINNKLTKLIKYANEDSPYFDHLFHLIINKIRKLYHKMLGISKIPTSKVARIYTDTAYRNSMYKQNPDPKFVSLYLNLITNTSNNKLLKLNLLQELYYYITTNIKLSNDYRIPIKSRNKLLITNQK